MKITTHESVDDADDGLDFNPPHPSSPMVLHVRVVSGSGGGPEKTILRSARHAQAAGLRMVAAYLHPAGDVGMTLLHRQAAEHGCPLVAIPERGALDLRSVRTLVHLCRQKRVTIWHAHDYKSNLLGLIVRRLWPMKLVTTVHGWTNKTGRGRLYYALDRQLLRFYDRVLVVSPALRTACLRHGVSAGRLSYVPNAIDSQEFKRRHGCEAVRYELGIGCDRFVIGLVGRLSEEKGVDRAIRTLRRLHDTTSRRIELHLIGDGPQRTALRDLARRLGLETVVHFWGWQPNVRRLYEMMDMLLSSSHDEGTANVILEAMAMGVPVAATNVGGAMEMLDAGRCGVLLDADRDALWADHIAPLVVSGDRRQELARRGRERAKRVYSFERRMQAVIGLYRDLLRVRRADSTPDFGPPHRPMLRKAA